MRGEEAADARQQPARSERRHHADAKLPRVAVLDDFANRFGELGQRNAYACSEASAFIGQTDTATGAFGELHAEVVLQPLQLMTDRAVRQVQPFGRLGQAAGPGNRLQRA